MSKRGENIHKRKDGRWEARIVKKNDTGKKSYHSVYGKTYKEAKEKKEIFIQNKNKVTLASKKTMTFDTLLELWLQNRFFQQKESTKLKYLNLIEAHIAPSLGNIKVAELNDTIINQFLSQKRMSGNLKTGKGLSNSYVKSMAIIISSALSYAVEKDYCLPLKSKIIRPAIEKKEISILTEKEQSVLEEHLTSDNSLTALGIIIALNTGLRIGEICALKWDDIDLDNKVIKVRNSIARVPSPNDSSSKTQYIISTPKTQTSTRDIPITSKLFTSLKKYNGICQGYVMSNDLTFVCPRTFEYRYHKLLRQYNFPDTNFHTLRHTFATRCVEKSIDIKTLSEILGHANVSITLNTYVHPSFESKRNQLEKLCFK